MGNSKSSSGGIGITGTLAVVFIVLKLVGVIAWSWLWVLSPLWIPLIVLVVWALVCVFVYFIKKVVKRVIGR